MILVRSPSCWRQAYSGMSWCRDGILRANLVNSSPERAEAGVGAVDELGQGARRAAVGSAQGETNWL